MAPVADLDFQWPTKECHAYGRLDALNGADSTQYTSFEKATYQTSSNSMLFFIIRRRVVQCLIVLWQLYRAVRYVQQHHVIWQRRRRHKILDQDYRVRRKILQAVGEFTPRYPRFNLSV